MDGCTGEDASQAADEGNLIIATSGLVCGLHMHLLRRWARNRNDERGDFDDDDRSADRHLEDHETAFIEQFLGRVLINDRLTGVLSN